MTFSGIIHGTTRDYALPEHTGHDRIHDKCCPECGDPIQDRSTYCKPCAQQLRRTVEDNRRLFAHRAARLTRVGIEALTAEQMVRVRKKLAEWREVER